MKAADSGGFKNTTEGVDKMIGLGKWVIKVNTLFFKGDIVFEIKDNNGEYDISFTPPEKFKNVGVRYYDIREEGGALCGKGEISLLPGKVFEARATFNGDSMTSSIKLPVFGNKEMSFNGRRIG